MDLTTPSPITTAIRDALKGIGGILTATGVLTDSQVTLWTGIILFAVTSGYAIYKQVAMRKTA